MLQSYEGYLEADGRFYPTGTSLKMPKTRRRVRVIELEEQEQEPKTSSIEEDLKFWAEFDRMAEESADENYALDDFEPLKTNRELIIFSDEEQ